jgi:DNA-binding GntR family transcriptional regulator
MGQTLNEGWYASLHAPGRLESSIEEHGRLLQAILNHDQEEASRAMEDHLRNALKDIQHYFGTL